MASWLNNRRPADCQQPYLRARWYDAEVGRWVSEDPIGFAAGDANLTRYVGNVPISRIDPSGFVEHFALHDTTPLETGNGQPPRQGAEGINEKPVDPENPPTVVKQSHTPGARAPKRQLKVWLGLHAYIAVETYNENTEKFEWSYLHLSQDGYTVESEEVWGNVVLSEGFSTNDSNALLIQVWEDLEEERKEGHQPSWNPGNNCWVPALQFYPFDELWFPGPGPAFDSFTPPLPTYSY